MTSTLLLAKSHTWQWYWLWNSVPVSPEVESATADLSSCVLQISVQTAERLGNSRLKALSSTEVPFSVTCECYTPVQTSLGCDQFGCSCNQRSAPCNKKCIGCTGVSYDFVWFYSQNAWANACNACIDIWTSYSYLGLSHTHTPV